MKSAALAKIHIARKELKLQEEDYRAILRRVAGVESAAGLDDAALEAVLAELRRLGWKPAFTGKKPDRADLRMIFGLWAELGRQGALVDPSRSALRAFVGRQEDVSDPEFLRRDQAQRVIEALKAWLRRVSGKR